MGNQHRVFVIGVGMTRFEKPGSRDWDYPDMARESGSRALADAGISFDEIEEAFAGFVYGDSCAGERGVYELGMTGIPIYNVNNNCSTGSTALYGAARTIRGGLAGCTLAIGFEKMEKGSLGAKFMDREQPTLRHFRKLGELFEFEAAPPAPMMFGMAAREHMQRYGSTPDHYAWIGYKNHKHSVNNPNAQFQTEYTLDEIKAAAPIYHPLTKLQCSPTSDGSAAAVLASERFVDEHGLWDRAVEIIGQSMVTDMASTFEDAS
ncbi:MAG: lipid-transfer protein, partial [Candidatus Dormibacteria bacterium]